MDIKKYFTGPHLALTLIVIGVGLNIIDNMMAGKNGSTGGGPIFGANAPLGGIDNAIGFDVMGVHVSPGGELALVGIGLWLWHRYGR